MTILLGMIDDGDLAIVADGRAAGDKLLTETAIKTAKLGEALCVGFAGHPLIRVPIMANLVRHPEWAESDNVFYNWEKTGKTIDVSYMKARLQVEQLIQEHQVGKARGKKLVVLLGGKSDGVWALYKWSIDEQGRLTQCEACETEYPNFLGQCPSIPDLAKEQFKAILREKGRTIEDRLVDAARHIAKHSVERAQCGVKTVNSNVLVRTSRTEPAFISVWHPSTGPAFTGAWHPSTGYG